MGSRQTIFFGVLEDFVPLVEGIENSIELRYFKSGLFDDLNISNHDSLLNSSNFGTPLSGDWNRIDTYVVLENNTQLKVRKIPQRAGGVRFAVDQLVNIDSVVVRLGGIFEDGVIVAGSVGTVSDTKKSIEIYDLFSKAIKRRFKRIGAFYVGTGAENCLKQGWRLVTNTKSHKDYDLRIQ